MNCKQVLARLRAMGSAQTRKIYRNHGVTGEMYGVKYGDLAKLVKQIKVDHELALELWDSGNHDARTLATFVADPQRMTGKTLGFWIRDVDNHALSYSLARLAGRSPAGRKLMPKWMAANGEWPSATGWMMLAQVAAEPGAVTKKECRTHLATIKKNIHGSKNRVKYSMNTAMIAMGAYVPGLEEEAVKVADSIGQVEVDHGLTDCKTPLATPYIRKAAAHHRAKLARAARGRTAKKTAKTVKTAKMAKTAGRKTAARASSAL